MPASQFRSSADSFPGTPLNKSNPRACTGCRSAKILKPRVMEDGQVARHCWPPRRLCNMTPRDVKDDASQRDEIPCKTSFLWAEWRLSGGCGLPRNAIPRHHWCSSHAELSLMVLRLSSAKCVVAAIRSSTSPTRSPTQPARKIARPSDDPVVRLRKSPRNYLANSALIALPVCEDKKQGCHPGSF